MMVKLSLMLKANHIFDMVVYFFSFIIFSGFGTLHFKNGDIYQGWFNDGLY